MAQFELDTDTKKGLLSLRHGGQVVTTKTVNGNVVRFDSAGEIVDIILPNPVATVNLAGIPFKRMEDHADAVRVLNFHGVKSGG